ncbi:MAG: hypothetical protein AB8F95_11710 [Bacteroidia bacterium]
MVDRKFRAARVWSNRELEKVASLFKGDIANISGWTDTDKEGSTYKDYFNQASSYSISNYKSDARGFQGDQENEFFLDLEQTLDPAMEEKFDVVFNHTVLEHVFEVGTAFENLCKLSKDVVIVVVPFLQEQHADYGDYWRFTPLVLDKLFEKNGLKTLYLNFNDESKASIYMFAIGSKNPDQWESVKRVEGNRVEHIYKPGYFAGKKIIKNALWFRVYSRLSGLLKK